MSIDMLNYKGYTTQVEFSAEDGILYGRVDDIRDLVDFQCESASEVEHAFHDAVDNYLEFCAELGQTAEQACELSQVYA